MKLLWWSLSVLVVVAPLGGQAGTATAGTAQTLGVVTVPMQLELDRPYIDVTLTGPDGRSVKARAWVDTGGGALLLSAGLAKQLGLKPTAKAQHEEGHLMAPVAVPALRVGDTPVTLANAGAIVVLDAPKTLNHTDAEVGLPGRFLQRYVVVFDYPAKTFTLADPGKLKPSGTAVKTYLGDSGMPVVWLSVAGKSCGFLMDTGGQDSMISTVRLAEWMRQHPDWRHVSGAYGPADMLLGNSPRRRKMENQLHMLRIGSMQWGPFDLENVSAVSRPAGVYEKWMSKMLDKPVIGSVAGNVLRDFRVTVDYPAGKVYLKRATTKHDTDIDMVGLMLEPVGDGGYEVVRRLPGVSNVTVGDRLLQVDGHTVHDAAFSNLVGWLGGKPGQLHRLTLERGGKTLTVNATVSTVL